MTEFDNRTLALAKFLSEDPEDVDWPSKYDECEYELGRRSYLVLTDEEADERTAEYIQDSLWAFNSWFVLSHSKIEMNDRELQRIQKDMCERANPLIEAMIVDMDDFVADAIDADGRGHFLSHYDGQEHYIEVDDEEYFIYRTN